MTDNVKMKSEDLQLFINKILNKQNHCNPPTFGIEFFCGECCKKVINGQFIFFIPGFICLLPPAGEHLTLKIFSEGELVEVQKLTSICVAIDKLCAIEGNPKQVWPACDEPNK